jgi:hypothetical protein
MCTVAHPRAVAADPTPPAPGSLTVPVTFGWQDLLEVLGVVVAVAAVVALIGLVAAAVTPRSEWQAWLDARPSRHAAPERPDDDEA